MRRFVRASLSSAITSPRDLAKQSSPSLQDPVASTSADLSSKTAAWLTETAKEPLDTSSHWLVLVPYRFHDRGFNFDPIVREFREEETRIVIKRLVKRVPSPNDNIQATEMCFASRVVSRNHAEIWCENGGDFCIRDVSSSSGTFLNGERLSAGGQNSDAFPLKDDDILQLGVEVDDGVEMVDRAVKIRVVIGHGTRRMKLSRLDPLYKPQYAADDVCKTQAQHTTESLQDAPAGSAARPSSASSCKESSQEPSGLVVSTENLAEGGVTSKDTLCGDDRYENGSPLTAVQGAQSIVPLVGTPWDEDRAPPRYRTPSPTVPPSLVDQMREVIQSPMLQQSSSLDSQSAAHSGNALTQYASKNRHMISPELERKLLKAHYLPEDNPDEISQHEWQSEYGVGHFELKRLRQLYARNFDEGRPG